MMVTMKVMMMVSLGGVVTSLLTSVAAAVTYSCRHPQPASDRSLGTLVNIYRAALGGIPCWEAEEGGNEKIWKGRGKRERKGSHGIFTAAEGGRESTRYGTIKIPSSPHHRHMRHVYGDSRRKLRYFSPQIFGSVAARGDGGLITLRGSEALLPAALFVATRARLLPPMMAVSNLWGL